MFESFMLQRVDVGEAELRVRHGGTGPAVLLLHGHPRTHVTWHKVAPVLAERFTVHAMIEDYRAGLGIDRQHDKADRAAGRRIGCPLLFLWAARDDLEDLYGDPLAIWREWADDIRGRSIDCGHHIAKEAPAELAAHLTEFFG